MIDPEKQTRSVLATLEQCKTVLTGNANRETAQLLSVAILQLRMKLNHIADVELTALCDAIVDNEPAKPDHRKPQQHQRHIRRGATLLRLVK